MVCDCHYAVWVCLPGMCVCHVKAEAQRGQVPKKSHNFLVIKDEVH